MAQHLRVGSVVDVYSGGIGNPPTHPGAVVTNITGSYMEYEWTDPATSTAYVLVRTWANLGVVRVVTD